MANNNDYNRKVYSCAIQNDSDGDAHVVYIYAEVTRRDSDIKNTRVEQDVAKGQKRYIGQRLLTRDTYNVIEVVERIEVTLANGKKLELTAPFEGVKTPVTDWLFVFNNKEIKSTGPNK